MLPLLLELLNQNFSPIGTIKNYLLMALTGMLFLVVAIAWLYRLIKNLRQPIGIASSNIPYRCGVFGWLAGLCIVFIVVVTTILYGDPRGMYGTGPFSPEWLIARPVKVQGYVNLKETPDIVIMGSSLAFTISPSYIQESLGFSAFNASVEGGRAADSPVFMRFMLSQKDETLPKVLIIESQPYGSADIPIDREPSSLFPFLKPVDQWRFIYTRYSGLFELDQFSEALYNIVRDPVPPVDWEFQADGEGILPLTDLSSLLDQAIDRGSPYCVQPGEEEKDLYREIVKIASDNQTAVIFLLTPYHPRYYDLYMAPGSKFYTCKTNAVQFLEEMALENKSVYFLDYSELADIHGIDTADGYYDFQHLTRVNSDLLIHTASDTIRQAYEWASAERYSR